MGHWFDGGGTAARWQRGHEKCCVRSRVRPTGAIAVPQAKQRKSESAVGSKRIG